MARYAAIDIGSNSVRLLAAEVLPGSPARVLATDREVTRLGASVFTTGRVSLEAMDLVCSVLRRFAEAYSKLDVIGVRAVATSAIRDASNQADFIARASKPWALPSRSSPGRKRHGSSILVCRAAGHRATIGSSSWMSAAAAPSSSSARMAR